MNKIFRIEPLFVEIMPTELAPGKLYICIKYATTQHLCACGCGKKVVLPLSPAEWNMCYDGETITMSPSVGNWEYSCRSHYWIELNEIKWAKAWTTSQIESGRRRDIEDLQSFFEARGRLQESSESLVTRHSKSSRPRRRFRFLGKNPD